MKCFHNNFLRFGFGKRAWCVHVFISMDHFSLHQQLTWDTKCCWRFWLSCLLRACILFTFIFFTTIGTQIGDWNMTKIKFHAKKCNFRSYECKLLNILCFEMTFFGIAIQQYNFEWFQFEISKFADEMSENCSMMFQSVGVMPISIRMHLNECVFNVHYWCVLLFCL